VRNAKFYFGQRYTQRFTFSEQFVTIRDASGGEVIIPDGTLKMLFATLVFEKTGYFRVQVDYDHRPSAPNVATFEGTVLGGDVSLDAIPIVDGKFRVRVGGDSKRTTITVLNDSFLPSNFLSASFECNEVARARTRA
jgi:hypothetical protein